MQNKLFTKVFAWLSIGLFISFVVALYVSKNEYLLTQVFGKKIILFLVIELAVAFIMGLFIRKIPKSLLTILYIVYCIVSGFTLSSIFLIYKLNSITYIFFLASLIFIIIAIYGYKTNKDISKMGTILIIGLILVIIITFINIIFIKSSSIEILTTIISLFVFIGFIAYDMHILKNKMIDIDEDKLAIYGAFQLYLDFINLFLDLLRLFGNTKD